MSRCRQIVLRALHITAILLIALGIWLVGYLVFRVALYVTIVVFVAGAIGIYALFTRKG